MFRCIDDMAICPNQTFTVTETQDRVIMNITKIGVETNLYMLHAFICI